MEELLTLSTHTEGGVVSSGLCVPEPSDDWEDSDDPDHVPDWEPTEGGEVSSSWLCLSEFSRHRTQLLGPAS